MSSGTAASFEATQAARCCVRSWGCSKRSYSGKARLACGVDRDWQATSCQKSQVQDHYVLCPFTLQVARCCKRYVHDWRDCPFAHSTENARRRDPRECGYLPIACPNYKGGFCLEVMPFSACLPSPHMCSVGRLLIMKLAQI